MAENHHHASLGVISFGLALGLAAGIFIFLLGTVASVFGWGVPVAAALASIFVGFSPTFIGSIAGAVWAFATFFFFGVLVAWIYNRLLLRRRKTIV